METTLINPALKDLEMLVGSWTIELSNASFLPEPTAVIRGSMSFELIKDGAFLIMRQGIKDSGMPWSLWLIGRDQDADDYSALYFDDRGVSRVYQMSLAKGVLNIWRDSPKFSQRFAGKISKDKKTIKAQWEKSFDGKRWEHDFDIMYLRK
ncbi:MAG TPA: hypothetical protein VNE41_06150 [Chitinophagaceae bacterium]|nr:hypothetical protein [Chitinophagaceae bacterium]